jgi:oxygen-independent coproporphyrinogen-3 oxidase
LTAEDRPGPPTSLYVHLPFCRRRCTYCDFAITVSGPNLQDRYLDALLQELRFVSRADLAHEPLRTIHLGGGTPSLLGPARLARLLETVAAGFSLDDGCEVTLEANPEEVSPDAAREWAHMGITRASVGIQSLSDPTLLWLGRGHDAELGLKALGWLRESDIPQVSCDLMFAIPGQSTRDFLDGLDRVLHFQPDHLSCYELTLEPGTTARRLVDSGRCQRVAEPVALEQLRSARARLLAADLARYEVSNYSRPGCQSRHNLNYWRGGTYLALGSGSHGFLGGPAASALGLPVGRAAGVRYWHYRDATTYVRVVGQGAAGIRGSEQLDDSQLSLERLALGLRLTEGVDVVEERLLAASRRLAVHGWLEVEGERVRATPEGMEILDRLTLELIAA